MPKYQMTPKNLHELLEANRVVLIDVREPDEYENEHIPDAILIPLKTLSLDKLPVTTNNTIVIQCRSGRRSNDGCDALLAQNSKLELYNLAGGILAWVEEGFQTNKASVA